MTFVGTCVGGGTVAVGSGTGVGVGPGVETAVAVGVGLVTSGLSRVGVGGAMAMMVASTAASMVAAMSSVGGTVRVEGAVLEGAVKVGLAVGSGCASVAASTDWAIFGGGSGVGTMASGSAATHANEAAKTRVIKASKPR